MKQSIRKVIISATIAIVLFGSLASATTVKRDLQKREKRSFRWIPFFGGGNSEDSESSDSDVESETVDPTSVYNELPEYSSQYNGNNLPFPQQNGQIPIPDANAIGSIISQGHVINNNVHYPIWRVHKYNGIDLRPLPVSLVQQQQQQQQQEQQQQEDQLHFPQQYDQFTQYQLPESNNNLFNENQANTFTNQDSSVDQSSVENSEDDAENQLTPENPQSNQPIPFELLSLARQYGVTDFSKLPSLDEAMNLLGTTTQEETIQTIKEIASTDDGRSLIKQFLASGNDDNEPAASTNEDNVESADTNIIAQYLLPRNQSPGLFPFREIVASAQGEGENTATDEQQSNPNLFQRLSQWANFLNPLAGQEDIPLPPNDISSDIRNSNDASPTNENIQYITNQHTIPIPSLPHLPSPPSIPGVNINVPNLPELHIPRRSILAPIEHQYARQNIPRGGAYVRVKLPLAGFNPTPQIPINPTYLYHYQNQLARQRQQQQQFQPFHVPNQQSVQGTQVQTQVLTQFQPQVILQNYELPLAYAKNNFQSEIQPTTQETPLTEENIKSEEQTHNLLSENQQLPQVSPQIANVGQIPLIRDANYEVFKNAPRITTSYGTPALPYTYSLDESSNTFLPTSSGFIHQEYELRPAASEKDTNVDQTPQESIQRPIEQIVERSKGDGIEADEKNYETDNVEQQTESAILIESTTELPVKHTERYNINSIPPNMKWRKTIASNGPQRITSFDTIATGVVHKADPKAMELLPFSVRHLIKSEAKTN